MFKRKSSTFFMTLVLVAAMLFSACADATERPSVSHTLMVYMCGSDLESVRGYASLNIVDMLEADIPDGADVVIQTGGSLEWKDERIPDARSARFAIDDGSLTAVGDAFDADMGESDTLADFINFAKTNYPAEQYSLILWDHGTGSNGGVCYDELYADNCLTLPELSKAIAQSRLYFEFIGFDACLMATYDTVLALRDDAHFLVASQELEPGSGWDYSALSALGQIDFYNILLERYAEKQAHTTYYTLSVIDLTQSERLDVLNDYICQWISISPEQVAVATENGMQFGAGERGSASSGLYDMRIFAYNMGMNTVDFSDMINTVNGSAREGAFGISIYFPQDEDELAAYSRVCEDSDYLSILKSYYEREPVGGAIQFELPGFVFDNRMSFTLSADSLRYVRSVCYELHILNDETEQLFLYSIGVDNDILQASAMFTVDFEGRWVWLGGRLLHCSVYEERNGITLFSARVRIDGKDCLLLFSYNGNTSALSAEGYIELGDSGSRILPLDEGLEIEIVYYEPASGEYITEGVAEWGRDELSIGYLPAATYQIVPKITDVFGREYYAYTAFVEFDGAGVTGIEIGAG